MSQVLNRCIIETSLDTGVSGHVIASSKGDLIVDNGTRTLNLGVGSNNQVLIADSAEVTGVKWAAPAHNNGISIQGGTTNEYYHLTSSQHTNTIAHLTDTNNPHAVDISDVSPLSLFGDIMVHDGTNSISKAIGVNNQILMANSGEVGGIKWGVPDHNDNGNLQGGTSGQHYHLTSAQHSSTVSHLTDTANPHSVTIDHVTPTTTKGDLILENGSAAVRLAVGSKNQVLIADSAEATGVKWAAPAHNDGISIQGGTTNEYYHLTSAQHTSAVAHLTDTANPHSVTINQVTPTTTKGDIILENGSAAVRLAVGSNGQFLVADSVEATGVKWTDTAALINVDNLRLDANTLSSTNTNGDVNILPNGSGEVLLKADPISSLGAATKQYVDNTAQGLKAKDSVRVATTSAGVLATSFENGDIIDGITLVTNDRILVKNQSTGSENGIYIVNASGSPTRASDMVALSNAASAYLFIEEGAVNADTSWTCTNDGDSDVVSTDALVFSLFGRAGEVTASKIGTSGVGVLKQKNGANFEFKSINAGSNKITISDDTGDNEVDIDVVESNLTLDNIGGTLSVSKGGLGSTSFSLNQLLEYDGTGIISNKTIPSGVIIGTTDSQTLTNKTIISPVLTTPQLNDTSADHQYIFSVSELTADRTVTWPLLTGNDTLVFNDHTQTLTNKTIDADNNTISNIDNNDIKTSAGIDATKIADGSVTNTEFQYINSLTSNVQTQITNHTSSTTAHGATGAVVGTTNTQTLTNKTLNNPTVQNHLVTSASYIEVADITAPANPGAAKGRLYKKTGNDGLFWLPDAAGPEVDLTVDIDTGEVNTASNLGGGEGVYSSKSVSDLRLKSLVAGNSISLSSDANEITIDATNKFAYVLSTNEIQASGTAYETVCYLPWLNLRYSGYSNGTIIFEVVIAGRNLDIKLHDTTGATDLGSHATISTSGFYSFSVSNPAGNGRLELMVKKSASGGTNPKIYGVSAEFDK